MVGGIVISSNPNECRSPPIHRPSFTLYSTLLTSITCIGALVFGYDTGIISSVMLFLPNSPGMKPMSTIWQELIVSITPGFAAIGALVAGKSSDVFGRRPIIIVASCVFIIGAVVCSVAPEKVTLLVGRALLGVAIGFTSMIIPVYISEATPSYIRGSIITVYEVMVSTGFILANITSVFFATIEPYTIGWRLMFAFSIIPSVLQLFGFLYLKDTPRYLYMSGQKEVCQEVYGNDKKWVQYDLAEIHDALEEEKQDKKQFEHTTVIARIAKTPHVMRALLLGCSMQMFQQLIGINTILYYTSKIIQSAGVEDQITTIWISTGISAVKAAATLLPMKLIEKLGRRPILITSLVGVIISLCLMGATFVLINKDSASIDLTQRMEGIDAADIADAQYFDHCSGMANCDSCVTSSACGYCFPAGNDTVGQCLPINKDVNSMSTIGHCRNDMSYVMKTTCKTRYTALPIIVMLMYLIAFAFGMGPMPWVFNAEIYPLWARSTCVSIATFANWTPNLLIVFTFLSLGEAITKYGVFFLYAGFATVGLIIFYFFVPETKGMPIEEVEMLFMSTAQLERHKKQIEEIEMNTNQET